MAAGIIAAHNAFIKGLYSTVQAQQQSSLACLLPDEPAKVYPSEVNDSHSIVGKFRRWGQIVYIPLLFQSSEHTISAECCIFYHKYSSAASMASVTLCSWSAAAINFLLLMVPWSNTCPQACCRQCRLQSLA